jgi:glucose-6-phosphate isomerase
MDKHFVATNPRHNLPVLLALTDVWNDSFLGSTGRIVTPFTEAFAAYPAFCAALESQTCGNSADVSTCSSMVIDGGLHNAYDRTLYQTSRVLPSELVMTMDSQIAANAASNMNLDDVHASQDALICSMFAHADEMAFGTDVNKAFDPLAPTSKDNQGNNTETQQSEGNRPSTLIMCGKCDAFTCGQLVALAEHRAVVKARIWDVDPFAREVGSSLRSKRTEKLKEDLQKMFTNMRDGDDADDEDDDDDKVNDGMNLSTKTILGHYANLMRDQRIYTVKG